MKLTDFTSLTFDVMGTLMDYEAGFIAWFRRHAGAGRTDLADERRASITTSAPPRRSAWPPPGPPAATDALARPVAQRPAPVLRWRDCCAFQP